MQHFDIIIVGGGPVGLTTALTLCNDSLLTIAIVDPTLMNTTEQTTQSIRVSAINRASELIFRHLNLWQELSPYCAPYQAIEVWEQDCFAKLNCHAKEIIQPNLGYIVNNDLLQQQLLSKIKQNKNIQLFMNPTQSLQIDDHCVQLQLTKDRLSASLLIAADGAHSWIREQLETPIISRDYQHVALIATIKTAAPHQQTARQIFITNTESDRTLTNNSSKDSILAFLPLADPNLSSIVWSLPPQKAQQLSQIDESIFNKELATAFDMTLGLCELQSQRLTFPLTMRLSQRFAQNRVAFIGDAAHTIHPLAGQGVNLGLLDGASLAQEVLCHHHNNNDIGIYAHLRHYERWRKTEALKMIMAMEAIKQGFSGHHPIKKLIRNIGLSIIEELPLIKPELMKTALGLTGELPDICRF